MLISIAIKKLAQYARLIWVSSQIDGYIIDYVGQLLASIVDIGRLLAERADGVFDMVAGFKMLGLRN